MRTVNCDNCGEPVKVFPAKGSAAIAKIIIAMAARVTGYTKKELTALSRGKPIARARTATICVMREWGDMSWELCGEVMGKRHITTAYGLWKKYSDEEEVKEQAADIVEALETQRRLEA